MTAGFGISAITICWWTVSASPPSLAAWQRYTPIFAAATLEPTPFTAFSDVVAEYELTGRRRLAARRRFLARKSAAAAAAGHALPAAAGRANPTPRIHRLEQRCDPQAFAELVQCGAQQKLNAADMTVALLALWVSRLSGQPSFSAGFIFMRRTGSAALCAAGR